MRTLVAVLLLAPAGAEFTVEKSGGAVVVKSGAMEPLRYQLQKPASSKLSVDSAAYFHPFTSPSGVTITDVAPDDHLHHRGIFLAWVEMHGKKDADFWGWGQYAPKKDRKIVNKSATDLAGGAKASFKISNQWMAEEVALLQEDIQASLSTQGAANVLDLVYTLSADADVKLSKWAFSGFCLRMRKDKDSKLKIENPDGDVRLPAPNHMKPESDWPAATWYAYGLTLGDGTQVGGAVIDHPKNPKALWHNAASIRMLNPCIVAPQEVVIKAGEPLVLRYRVVAFDGATPKDQLNQLAQEWAR